MLKHSQQINQILTGQEKSALYYFNFQTLTANLAKSFWVDDNIVSCLKKNRRIQQFNLRIQTFWSQLGFASSYLFIYFFKALAAIYLIKTFSLETENREIKGSCFFKKELK